MTYNDPTFGCPVTRITDASQDDLQGSVYEALDMGYATISPFNANDTYLMLSDVLQNYFVTDLQGQRGHFYGEFPAAQQRDLGLVGPSESTSLLLYQRQFADDGDDQRIIRHLGHGTSVSPVHCH
jgi:hypothetical protein